MSSWVMSMIAPVAASVVTLAVVLVAARWRWTPPARWAATLVLTCLWLAVFLAGMAPRLGMLAGPVGMLRYTEPLAYYAILAVPAVLLPAWYVAWKAVAPKLAYGLIITLGALLCVPYVYLMFVNWSDVPSSAVSGAGYAILFMAIIPLPFLATNLFCGLIAAAAPVDRATLSRLFLPKHQTGIA